MLHAVGFDVGTSGLKAVLVDESGRPVRSVRVSYPLQTPGAGWAEQDPDVWWRALLATGRELLDGIPAPDAIGLTGQMHSAVALGPGHAPLGAAMLWNDQRAVRECAELSERLRAALACWTGNPIRTTFSVAKILWLRRHRPDLYGSIGAILLAKDFLRLRLTGVLATDVTDASGTGVFDVHRRRWSEDALQALEIRRAWLPDAHESALLVSRVDRRGARSSGLSIGTPVAAGAGDQAAAALGSGGADPGILSLTLGTSATVQLPIALPLSDPSGVFQTFCHGLPDTWQLLAAVLSGGGSLAWYHGLAIASEDSAAMAADEGARFEGLCGAAATVPPGAEGLIFLPHLTGEAAPHLDPEARGAWFGLTRRHDHRHLARAVIEGVAFALRGVVEAAEALGGRAREIRVSGGASQGRLWVETLANVLGRRVTVAGTGDASARGAALLAVAAVTGQDPRALAAAWAPPGSPIDPQPALLPRYQAQYAIFRDLYPATRHLMHRLTDLERTGEATSDLSPTGR